MRSQSKRQRPAPGENRWVRRRRGTPSVRQGRHQQARFLTATLGGGGEDCDVCTGEGCPSSPWVPLLHSPNGSSDAIGGQYKYFQKPAAIHRPQA
ncbi:hypothetical protein MRX96_056763 [Rhipicephalus microplus]